MLDIGAAAQQHKAAAKGQTIVVGVTPPDLAVTADAAAIAEVLKRLLDNAVKFTPEGGRIGLEAHLGTAGTANIVVWDTGIGITEGELGHVFHAFTQVDARLARSHNGIGLGLAYVDQMVRLLGGTIAVESTPGEGSRFTITLPACVPCTQAASAQAPWAQAVTSGAVWPVTAPAVTGGRGLRRPSPAAA